MSVPVPTIFQVIAAGNVEAVTERIIKDPSLLTLEDDDKRKPIHHAVSSGRLDVLQALLRHQSPIFVSDEAGWTPLHIAASKKRLDMVKLLLETIKDSSDRNDFISAKTESGQTALHYAASKNAPDIVDVLMDMGASPSIRDHFGQEPIHRAATVGSVDTVKRILRHSPELINHIDKEMNTPLYLAVENGHVELAKYLWAEKADATIENREGLTAWQIAETSRLTDQIL